jgi:hypothetical protein
MTFRNNTISHEHTYWENIALCSVRTFEIGRFAYYRPEQITKILE